MSDSDKAFEKWWATMNAPIGKEVMDICLEDAAFEAWHAAIHWKNNQLFAEAGRKRNE